MIKALLRARVTMPAWVAALILVLGSYYWAAGRVPMSALMLAIAAMRAYLRQWIAGFFGSGAADLAGRVDKLTSRAAIEDWLDDATEIGIDPL